jgi:glycerophosphoryl diester phosphodiesterase
VSADEVTAKDATAKQATAKISPVIARPLLLGHRGARADKSILENTFASFDRALADGCDGFEFDVRMTGDGEAVICHDPRCHDPKAGSVEIAEATGRTLAQLPRLNQVLKRYRSNAFLDIELKVGGLEKQVSELLRRYKIRRGFVVSSFLPGVLRDLHAEDQSLPLGLICETRKQLEQCRELPVDYVMVRYPLAAQRLIREMQEQGRQVFAWTVNQPATARKFADWKIDGIISDDTRMLTRALKPQGRS